METILLHALRDRARFKLLRSSVPEELISPEAATLLKWYAAYFGDFPNRNTLELAEFREYIKLRCKDNPELLLALVKVLERPVPQDSIDRICATLTELSLSGKAAALIAAYQRGDEIDLAYELKRLSEDASRTLVAFSEHDENDASIVEILDNIEQMRGLRFPISALRDGLMPIQPGTSIAVAARPDAGKTSFIAFSVVEFAKQLQELGDDRPILWLNNEGTRDRIIPRIYSAALKTDIAGLIERARNGTIESEFAGVVGDVNRIIVKDIHGFNLGRVDQMIERLNPSVVIADMLANIHMSYGAGNKADQIEQLWQEWREMMVRHNSVGIGTVQISVEGSNNLFPPLSALKDSKTGIQGATDLVIMLGSLDDPSLKYLRGVSTPKNKLQAPHADGYIRAEVIFEPTICNFKDGNSEGEQQ